MKLLALGIRLSTQMFFLYSVLLTIGFIVMIPRFLFDAATKGKYAAGFRQRLGRLPDFDAEGKPVVWVHCVSVGEAQAARPLVKAIANEFPSYKIVISTTTNTGQKLAQEIFAKEAALIFYFPFDWKFSVRRSLDKINPAVVLLMETEIWPNFIREAGKIGASVVIVNGRLSEKSEKRYRWVSHTFRRIFHYVDMVLMQTAGDMQRINALGVRGTKVFTTGSIKFDQEIIENKSKVAKELAARFGFSEKSNLILAASTHEPEEKIVLEAFGKLRKQLVKNLPRLMIAPRHPERFDEVAGVIEKAGFSFAKRSAKPTESIEMADVILLDSIGELRDVYSLADIVFVGGSLIPHGGQNILEPAAAKKAIVTGHYTMNFKAIVEEFVEKEAIRQLPEIKLENTPEELAEVLIELLQNEEVRNGLAENAFELMQKNQGATQKTIAKLRPFFEAKASVHGKIEAAPGDAN